MNFVQQILEEPYLLLTHKPLLFLVFYLWVASYMSPTQPF